jgi:RNA polymerase sigma factor (TIGR02999 family)
MSPAGRGDILRVPLPASLQALMAELTDLLQSARAGDAAASARLFNRVYADLKRIAHGRLYRSGGAAAVGLNTTALVHESFLRLVDHGELAVDDRCAFFGYVGRVMRSVLIDHLREQRAAKRGGGEVLVTLTTGVEGEVIEDERLIAINEALVALERIAPTYHELVEMRYFAGLSMREVAEVRGISMRSAEREWEKARAFLVRLMDEG